MLYYLNIVSVPDEATAIKVVQLPLLDTMEQGDTSAIIFLADLSVFDPAGFAQLVFSESPSAGDNTPIQLQYLKFKDPEAAAEITAQEWATDEFYLHHYLTLNNLVESAAVSKKLFRYLLDGNRSWIPLQNGRAASAVYKLVKLSHFDEDTVLKMVAMPFMDTIESTDWYVVDWLYELARDDPEAMQRILSRTIVKDGVTDEEAIYLGLFILEESSPRAAASIEGLSWVQDGLKYIPPRNWVNVRAPAEDFETENVFSFIYIGLNTPDFLLEITMKPWVRDGLDYDESGAIHEFEALVQRAPESALRVLNLPFLTTFDQGDWWVLSDLVELSLTDKEAFDRELEKLEAAGGS